MNPITYGLRKKGEAAIIGVIPIKVHERPASSAEFTENYEEVPLYGQSAIEELRGLIREVMAADWRTHDNTLWPRLVAATRE